MRDLLLDYVNNQMGSNDLVAIVSVIGGSGLLQQYTSDKDLLRKAISRLNPKVHPFSANTPGFSRMDAPPTASDTTGSDLGTTPDEGLSGEEI